MKIGRFFGTCIGILAVVILVSGCKARMDVLERMKALEQPEYKGKELSDKRIAELKEGIAQYEKEVDRTIKASEQIGVYYRMLGLAYVDRQMYGEALATFEKAISYYPENPNLFNYAGLCAARMAKASVGDEKRRSEYFNLAENYYKRAISIDSGHVAALYGLSILYIFELNRELEAKPLLESILAKQKKNFEAMFLLARIRVVEGAYEDAAALYDTIIKESPDKRQKEEAEKNKRTIMGGSYGS